MASSTNILAGDGTATSTVLARAIFREGSKALAASMNLEDLQRGSAVNVVLGDLQTRAKPISNPEEMAVVKAPGFRDQREALLQDANILCDARLLSEEGVRKLEDCELSVGTSKTVSVSKDYSGILGGSGG